MPAVVSMGMNGSLALDLIKKLFEKDKKGFGEFATQQISSAFTFQDVQNANNAITPRSTIPTSSLPGAQTEQDNRRGLVIALTSPQKKSRN